MKKVIAVFDDPGWCFVCPCFKSGINMTCSLAKRLIESISLKERPDWCPLKDVISKGRIESAADKIRNRCTNIIVVEEKG